MFIFSGFVHFKVTIDVKIVIKLENKLESQLASITDDSRCMLIVNNEETNSFQVNENSARKSHAERRCNELNV